MKVLVIYDSMYGNTEKIARAISETITGEVKVLRVAKVNLSELESIDLLIIGSPTQGGRSTASIQDFLNKLPESIKGMKVAVFDTRLSTRFVGIFGYAAGKIADSLKAKGMTLIAPPKAFYVKSKEGPLKDGELERAVNWTKDMIRAQEV